ncbi:MAG: preprotein translocase subunit SecG [Haliscomenobacter sp.]|nr:preprotein translocase subunit SecG [Haliscomenobacter sp.]MBK8879136.1 preprotein translocase subunit SecG [Haliscomenobacter sp.]
MTVMTILIAFISLMLMVVVLIQNSKGGGVDATLGGSQANHLFGAAKSADFIEKLTWYLAAALFILCIIATMIVGSNVPVDPTALPPQ